MLTLQFCCHKVFSVVGETIYIKYFFEKKHRVLCCIVAIRHTVSTRNNIFDTAQQNLKYALW